MLNVAVAWSSVDDDAVCYAYLVLWMTSWFHIMAPMEQNRASRYVSLNSAGGGTGDEV